MMHLILAWVTILAVAAGDVKAVDGDTVDAAGDRWRLTGFDTPETRFAKCAREWMLGIVAKNRLQRLVDGAARIEIHARRGRDKHGRGLGALMIDGEDAAGIMVREGLARPYSGRGKRGSWCGGGWTR
ncbi:MAG: thermonuclease family protein [Hyphomicrobium sp.]